MPIETFDVYELKRKAIVRDEYDAFCVEENMEPSPHTANVFAIRKVAGGHDYRGLTERKLILFLAGDLPQMYD